MPNTKNYDLDTDTTLGGNNASDYVVSSQKAIKGYVDNHSGGSTPTITVSSDYNGNVVLDITGFMITDDDAGNVVISSN